MKVRWSSVLLKVKPHFHFLKEIVMKWNHDFQHLQVSLTRDSIFRTDISTHLAPFHRLQMCIGFLLLLLLLVVVYQIQPSNVVELQQHSPLSNNTSVTPLSNDNFPPCLFKHKKNDECVAMLFQCLLDHTQQKLYSVSFRC